MKRNFWREKVEFRIVISGLFLLLPFGLLAIRLWQVQVADGRNYRHRTLRQSVRPMRMNPVRGRIFSADGVPLADNLARYDLAVYTSEMRQPGPRRKTLDYILQTDSFIAQLLQREQGLDMAKLKRHIGQNPVMPMVLYEDLSQKDITLISEMTPPWPGVVILPRNDRFYRLGGTAAHVLGFTAWNWPDSKAIQQDYARIYHSRQLSGRSGLEKLYNEVLSGSAGARLVQVDSLGYVHRQLEEVAECRNGSNLILTLDAKAQVIAEEVLKGHTGALVLLNVHTGGVLAMASAPSFDISNMSYQLYRELLKREKTDKPMLNRAVNGFYTPGSIVKPLTALAALQAGVIVPETEYDCIGFYRIGGVRIHCSRRWGHGILDLREAISVSCNPYIIFAGIRTGIDRLAPMYKAAGLGEKTGIELQEADWSLAPSRDAARKLWKRNWLMIDTAYVSMGQGAVMVTPLQMAVYVSALANGGKVLQPHLVQAIQSPDGMLEKMAVTRIRHRLPVSPENLQIVREGMIMAVERKGASAVKLQKAGIRLAAKTGTAEVGSGENRHKDTWIICYGPVEDPQYGLACVIERSESGGRTVAPVVSEFFQRWLGATENPVR